MENKRKIGKKEQRAASIKRILAAALELFVRNGYRATTVEMIADKAGLTKGGTYFYFDSKTAIMLRLIEDAELISVDPIEACSLRAGRTAIDKLIEFVNGQAQIARSNPQHSLLLILMSVEFNGANSDSEARVRAVYQRLYVCVERIIDQGQSEGTIRTDISRHELTSLVVAQRDGILIEWYRRPGEIDGESLARAARLAILDAVFAREETAERVVRAVRVSRLLE